MISARMIRHRHKGSHIERRRSRGVRTCVSALVLLTIVNVAIQTWCGAVVSSVAPLEENATVHTLTEISPEMDDEWIPVLRSGEIVYADHFNFAGSAISEKHLLYVRSSTRRTPLVDRGSGRASEMHPKTELYKAILKMAKPLTMYGAYHPETLDADETYEPVDRPFPRTIQGIGELGAVHVDRLLNGYRKPPAVSRYVSSTLLYGGIGRHWSWLSFSGWSKFKRSLRFTIYALSPEFEVPVVISPWMDGLYEEAPSLSTHDSLVSVVEHPRSSLAAPQLVEMLDVSDILVFDFLVDEHDRKNEKNWISRDGERLQWDNGLSWWHGPVGRARCISILCGLEWAEKHGDCSPICRFRAETISNLEQLRRAGGFGAMLRSSMSEEAFAHPFEMVMYEHYPGDSNLVSFYDRNFYDGMNTKLDRLLQHAKSCERAYGASEVYL